MLLEITNDLKQLNRSLEGVSARRLASVTASALTATAAETRKVFRTQARQKLDRPTAFTVNSTFIQRATAQTLTATVGFKAGSGRVGPGRYLGPLVLSGGRSDKAFELALKAVGAMPRSWRVVPADGARLDSFGNVSRAQIKEIVEAMRDYQRQGFQSAKAVSVGKTGRVKKQNQYFSVNPGGVITRAIASIRGRKSNLSPGIYRRVGAGNRQLSKVLSFVPSVRYRKTFELDKIAVGVISENFARLFSFYLDRSLQRRDAAPIVQGEQLSLL